MIEYNCKDYKFDVEATILEIQDILETLREPHLHDYVFSQLDNWLAFLLAAPRASENHDNFAGGLLLHTCYVMRYTVEIYRRMENPGIVDYDCMVLGAFLHDIGKALEPNQPDLHTYMGTTFVAVNFKNFPAVQKRLMLIVGNHMLNEKVDLSPRTVLETAIVHVADGFSAIGGLRLLEPEGEAKWVGRYFPADSEVCIQSLEPKLNFELGKATLLEKIRQEDIRVEH